MKRRKRCGRPNQNTKRAVKRRIIEVRTSKVNNPDDDTEIDWDDEEWDLYIPFSQIIFL